MADDAAIHVRKELSEALAAEARRAGAERELDGSGAFSWAK